MFSRQPLDRYTAGQDYTLKINQLVAEINRLGKITAAPPLKVAITGNGIHISGVEEGLPEYYAQLQEALAYEGSASAKLYKSVGDSDPLELGDDIKTVWASPLWNSGDSLDSGIDVQIRYFANYGKWFVVNAECGE